MKTCMNVRGPPGHGAVMDIIEPAKQSLLSFGTAPVIWLMVALSVVSLGVMLERAFFFARVRVDIDALVRELSDCLRAHDLRRARHLLDGSRSSEAAVARAGLSELRRGAGAVREALASATLLERRR